LRGSQKDTRRATEDKRTIVEESLDSLARICEVTKPPAKKVALAYIKSIEGKQTGQVYKVC
jgi:hypothetical protein